MLFYIWRGAIETAEIATLSLESGEIRTLVGGVSPVYAPTGHLVFGRDASLWAAPFDLGGLEVTGPAAQIVDDVDVNLFGDGGAKFALASDGSLVYVPAVSADAAGRAAFERTLVWVDRDGQEAPIAAEPRNYMYPRISPDGTRVVLDVRDQENDLWIWDFARETLTRLTFDPAQDFYPVWTPDGERVVFTSGREREEQFRRKLFWKAADGTGAAERLAEGDGTLAPSSFSPDGQRLVLTESDPGQADRRENLSVLSLNGDRSVEPLIATPFDEDLGEISPDGRWLAYESNASGETEIYVRPFPDVDDGQWLVPGR